MQEVDLYLKIQMMCSNDGQVPSREQPVLPCHKHQRLSASR